MRTTAKEVDSIIAAAGGQTGKIRMTAAMREGLEALQREYEAFRETSFQTLVLISDRRIDSK